MKLSDLPNFQKFFCFKDTKVLRHKATKCDLWTLRRDGKFARYQSRQSWDVYGRARYSLSFIAERHRFARFVGVWEVLSKRKGSKGNFIYKTREQSGFDDLKGRLIVNWGEGARSWAQWFHKQGNKEIVELLPPNYVMDFPGFYNFTLSYAQLQELINNPDSNREWQRMLSSVSGIYVILDQQSGLQYVGSAYGNHGVWGRWRNYSKNPSGGNVLLKKLLAKHRSRFKKFQFSILRVLEPSVHKDEVLAQEVLTKKKLGSRAFGLNT